MIAAPDAVGAPALFQARITPSRSLGRHGQIIAVGGFAAVFALSAAAVAAWSTIGEARPGIPLFWPDHPFNQAIAKIGEKFGGADNLVIFAEADRDEGVSDQEVLAKMQLLERTLKARTGAISLSRRMCPPLWFSRHLFRP